MIRQQDNSKRFEAVDKAKPVRIGTSLVYDFRDKPKRRFTE
jgi:hypothetical protein